MSIELACRCGKTFRVKDEYAGKKGKCPKCGHVLVIPEPIVELEEDPEEYGLAATGEYGLGEMLDEELAAAGASGASPRSSLGSPNLHYGGPGENIRLQVLVDVPINYEEKVIGMIRKELWRHLGGAETGVFRDVDLEVRVIEWEASLNTKIAAIGVTGTVNGRPVRQRFRSNTSAPVIFGYCPILSEGIEWLYGRERRMSSEMDTALTNCLEEMCAAIDTLVERSDTPAARRWKMLHGSITSLAVAAGAIAGLYAFLHAPCCGRMAFVFALVAAAWAGGCVYVPGVAVLSMITPNSFFQSDPKGRRVLKSFKVNTATGLRFRATVLLVMLAGCSWAGYHFYSRVFQGDKQNPRKAEQVVEPNRALPKWNRPDLGDPGFPDHAPPDPAPPVKPNVEPLHENPATPRPSSPPRHDLPAFGPSGPGPGFGPGFGPGGRSSPTPPTPPRSAPRRFGPTVPFQP